MSGRPRQPSTPGEATADAIALTRSVEERLMREEAGGRRLSARERQRLQRDIQRLRDTMQPALEHTLATRFRFSPEEIREVLNNRARTGDLTARNIQDDPFFVLLRSMEEQDGPNGRRRPRICEAIPGECRQGVCQ
jgi:hypothetical protein